MRAHDAAIALIVDIPTLGRRIAALRVAAGFTQSELAERVAISRVALSNLESCRSVPGERTVVLLAGVFDLEPHQLVDGADYPRAKLEKLPLVTTRHTEVDLQLALLEADLRWCEGAPPEMVEDLLRRWRVDLAALRDETHDLRERGRLDDTLRRLVRPGSAGTG